MSTHQREFHVIDYVNFFYSITSAIFKKLEGYLIQQFPSTEPGTWFVKSSGGKNPRGKLYDAYNEWKITLRNAYLRNVEKAPPAKKPCTEANNLDNTEIEQESLDRLTLPIDLERIDEAKQDWNITYAKRRLELTSCSNPKEIFEKYPVYQSVIGRDMVKSSHIKFF